jgi:hypothetical protein
MTSNGNRPHSTGSDLSDIFVGSFAKNAFEEVRVALRHYRGDDLVEIRVWMHRRNSMFRTRKGVVIKRRDLRKLIGVLADAQKLVDEEAETDAEDG